jgi:hypothetical protein
MILVIKLMNGLTYFYTVKFLALILGLLMLVRPVVPVLEYAVNYDYISKVLCINKQAPEKKCNGKCHLKKNLDEVFDEKKSEGTSGQAKTSSQIETVVIDVISLPSFEFNVSAAAQSSKFMPSGMNPYAYLFLSDFFHPPAGLV